MDKVFPQRVESHRLEELSFRFFQHALPNNWASEKQSHDYGVDLKVDLFEGENATGLELLVQLKASARPSGKESERVSLKTSTFNLLWGKLQVVMLVKYVQAENEAYWLLLKDVPARKRQTNKFTVHIPKANRLSEISWETVHAHVRHVTDTKLAAMRRIELECRMREQRVPR